MRRRRLGAELRNLREARGLTLAEAARELDSSDSTLSRIENGRARVRRIDVQAMLDLYAVTDEALREGLLRITRDVRHKGWWQDYTDVISQPYGDYISLETAAVSMQAHTIELVHGLLQTEDYTRAVAHAWLVWERPEEIEQFVAVRLARQQVLTRPDPLQVWAVMHEGALRCQVGGPAVLRQQLEHLRERAALPNVTLQVIPYSAGAAPTMDHPFVILGFAERSDPDVVCLDHLTSTLYLERDEEVTLYSSVFDHLRSVALAPGATLDLLTDHIKEL